jgi:hypothetical protein
MKKLKIKGFSPTDNKNGTGRYNSNVTGEDIIGNYDYGQIEDIKKYPLIKETVNEIIKNLRTTKDLPLEQTINQLELKFGLENIPMMKLEDSLWHQLTKDEYLGQSFQGYRITMKDDGTNKLKIPHIGFSSDLDYLDGFINRLIDKLENMGIVKKTNKKVS